MLRSIFFSVKISLLVFSVLCTGCRSKYDDCTEEDYRNCNTIRPVTGIVEVLLTIDNQIPRVTVSMFEGDFEDDNLIWEKEASSQRITEVLDVEKYYSFMAVYQRDGATITAVDGGEIEVIRYTMCEYTCYEAKDLTIDLVLK